MGKKKKKNLIDEDCIKAFRKANREIEMERNGGRWIAIDRPHRNKKKYYRKEKHKNNGDSKNLHYFAFVYIVKK
jgi:hypothetical protein